MKKIIILIFQFYIIKTINIENNELEKPKHIHLSISTKNEMNVIWWTEKETDSYIQYGLNKNLYNHEIIGITNKLKFGFGFLHLVELKNLRSSSLYYYRVGDKIKDIWSEQYFFRTAPSYYSNHSKIYFFK